MHAKFKCEVHALFIATYVKYPNLKQQVSVTARKYYHTLV